jgi:hypothetical protein
LVHRRFFLWHIGFEPGPEFQAILFVFGGKLDVHSISYVSIAASTSGMNTMVMAGYIHEKT